MRPISSFASDLGLSFIPIFVAMDAIGTLPFLLALTKDATPQKRSKAVRYAMLTALGLGLGFLAIGKGVFLAMGIETADFLIAGGLILLVLCLRELATGKMVEIEPRLGAEMVGVVPIGTPLVVGPAVLTTILILTEQHYTGAVVLAFMINLGITFIIFSQANRVAGFLGEGGLRAVAKIAALLLAAIAVKMMHAGITQIIAAMGS